MTAQICDTVFFKKYNFLFSKKVEYQIIGETGGELCSPTHFSMIPAEWDTSCYRGFWCTYEINNETLYLSQMFIYEPNKNYLPINGKKPMTLEEFYQKNKNFEHSHGLDSDLGIYDNISMIVPFTGKIRLANDFIWKYYVHMGYQKATAFKKVLDIAFKNGKILEIIDRSKEVKRIRGAFKKRYDSKFDPMMIQEAFNLDIEFDKDLPVN